MINRGLFVCVWVYLYAQPSYCRCECLLMLLFRVFRHLSPSYIHGIRGIPVSSLLDVWSNKRTQIANIPFYGVLWLAEALQCLNGIFYYALSVSFHYSFSSTDVIGKLAGRMDVLIKSFILYGCSYFLKRWISDIA